MMFNGINFKFGNVNVVVSSVDTEKATGYLEVKIPIGELELEVNLKRWIGWSGNTQVNLHFDLKGPEPIKPVSDPQDEEFDEEEEDDEEEST